MNFKRELDKKEITYRNMLINMLCQSTAKYPTKRLMNIATEELYELCYRGMNYISGKYNIMGFDVTFLNEEFTEKGMLKKGVLEEYMNTNRNSGIKVIKLKAEDKVIKVVFQDEEDVVLLSKNGLGLRLETKDITTTSKIAGGVIGMKLDKDDKLVTALPVHKTTDKLALFSFEGLGKKMELSEIPVQGRNTKGIMTGMTKLVGGLMISDEDSVMAIGTPNTICIEAKSITLQSKKGSGTKIIGDGSINYVTKI
jgi:DNA gyrase/topoisomerase IV subunit A